MADRDDKDDNTEHGPGDAGKSSDGQGGQGGSGQGGSGQGNSGSGDPQNPFEALFGGLGMPGQPGAGGQPGQMPDLNALMEQLQGAFKQMGLGGQAPGGQGGMTGLFGQGLGQPGGDNAGWETIRDTARKVIAGLGSDPSPSTAQENAVADAVRLAESWLDQATTLPAVNGKTKAWSRAEWIESTMPTWRRMVDPVAESMSEAMADTMTEGPSEMAGLEAMLRPWLKSSGASVFGLQAGQAIGKLAESVVSATETSLPLATSTKDKVTPVIALVPHNIKNFAEGLSQSEEDVTLYLALREAARQRLFLRASWLGPAMLNLVEQYASGITIDTSSIEQAITDFNPSELSAASLQNLASELEGNLFSPKQTPQQKEILDRLETLIALVEGWVDEVVAQATAKWMPSATALAETVRRRSATGGPREATFDALVGLELRPRRARDAANLWAALRDARGPEGRDAVWNHPDLLPTSADLDDPLGFVQGEASTTEDTEQVPGPFDDIDAEFAKLLDEEEKKKGGSGGTKDTDPGSDKSGSDDTNSDDTDSDSDGGDRN